MVLIDLQRNLEQGLDDLDRMMGLVPGAVILVLDLEAHEGVGELARELGATHVISEFVPPPVVAALIDRWIALSGHRAESSGWSQPPVAAMPLDIDEWLQFADADPTRDPAEKSHIGEPSRGNRASITSLHRFSRPACGCPTAAIINIWVVGGRPCHGRLLFLSFPVFGGGAASNVPRQGHSRLQQRARSARNAGGLCAGDFLGSRCDPDRLPAPGLPGHRAGRWVIGRQPLAPAWLALSGRLE